MDASPAVRYPDRKISSFASAGLSYRTQSGHFSKECPNRGQGVGRGGGGGRGRGTLFSLSLSCVYLSSIFFSRWGKRRGRRRWENRWEGLFCQVWERTSQSATVREEKRREHSVLLSVRYVDTHCHIDYILQKMNLKSYSDLQKRFPKNFGGCIR